MKNLKFLIGALIGCCVMGQTSLAQNVITDWAGIVQPAVLNAGTTTRPPGSSEVLHTTIQLAMYNAAMAVGSTIHVRPRLIQSPPSISMFPNRRARCLIDLNILIGLSNSLVFHDAPQIKPAPLLTWSPLPPRASPAMTRLRRMS